MQQEDDSYLRFIPLPPSIAPYPKKITTFTAVIYKSKTFNQK
jgi:hypothetical protein